MNEVCEVCDWECSPGTYRSEAGVCEPCPPGTYSKDFKDNCEECPAGTASNTAGNTSPRQCRPCEEGKFAASASSALCLECPKGYFCPVGSIHPTIGITEAQVTKSSQPAIYKSNSDLVSSVSFTMELGISVFGVIAILAYVRMQEKQVFRKLDLFKKSHNHFVDEVIHIRKRPIGGLFSVLFIMIALFFIVVCLATFAVDNVEETKALVPLVVIAEKYKALEGDFKLTTTFTNFVGRCEGDCRSIAEIVPRKLTGTYSTECLQADDDCKITLSCRGCEVQTGSHVSYSLVESSSYAAGISVNLTSTSSIPDEVSSIEQSIAAESNFVFRGPLATQIFFEITPSVRPIQIFISEADSNTDLTGFHIAATKAPVLGSQIVTPE
jgi:hypothetical protein